MRDACALGSRSGSEGRAFQRSYRSLKQGPGVASENTRRRVSRSPTLTSENTKPGRRGRAPVDLTGQYATVLDECVAALGSAPLAEQTRRTYASKVRQYLAWLGAAEFDGEPLSSADGRDWAVRDYRSHLQAVLTRKPATVNNALAAVDDLYIRRGLGPARASGPRSRTPRLARSGRGPRSAICARSRHALRHAIGRSRSCPSTLARGSRRPLRWTSTTCDFPPAKESCKSSARASGSGRFQFTRSSQGARRLATGTEALASRGPHPGAVPQPARRAPEPKRRSRRDHGHRRPSRSRGSRDRPCAQALVRHNAIAHFGRILAVPPLEVAPAQEFLEFMRATSRSPNTCSPTTER